MSKASLILCACLIAVYLEVSASPVPDGKGIFGDKFQGDIELTEEQKELFFGGEDVEGNTGTLYTLWQWPMNVNRQVVVPYRIEARHGFTTAQMNFLLDGMRRIEAGTCIRFVVRTNQVDFIDITNGDGCWSWLGRTRGRQELSMQRPGCFWLGTAEHEYIHALGFTHMHNAVNRNNFVTVNMQNIRADGQGLFNTVDPNWYSNFNTAYDLRSVMHYPRYAFQRAPGLDTIIPHDRAFIDIIGMGRLSSGDTTRLNRMYQC